jgi:hypothetical protein
VKDRLASGAISRQSGTTAKVTATPVPSRLKTRPYQFSLHTGRTADEVLTEFAQRRLPGIVVAERGSHYLVLRPEGRRRLRGEAAVLIAIAIVLAVLILTAVTPVFIARLPLALLPAIPFLFDHRPDLAISAVDDGHGGTRVTVHGQASAPLAAALDAYLGSLPRLEIAPEAQIETVATARRAKREAG